MRLSPPVGPALVIVIATGCLPGYTFTTTQASDAGADGTARDGAAADATAPVDSSADAEPAGESGSVDSAASDAAATDSSGFDAMVPESGLGITVDTGFPVTAEIDDAAGTTLSKTLDVQGGGRMLVAVVVWGQHGGSGVWPVTLSSPDLSWSNPVQAVSVGPSYPQAVGVGIWTAWAASGLASETVTATRSNDVIADAVMVVYSLTGASPTPGATGLSNGFSSAEAPLSVTVDAHAAGSFVIGGVLDGDGDPGVRGNTLTGTMYDATLGSASGDGIAIGHLSALTSGAGNVTLGQDQTLPYDVAAGIEILRQ